MKSIQFFPATRNESAIFSILIPTWNNIDYVRCCVDSLKKNSKYTHQIIVHVNEGSDGTLDWVKTNQLDYSYSQQNVGVCYGFNAASTLANTEFIILSDDDFYFAPDWDHHLLEEIRKTDQRSFCISGTMIEHSDSRNKCAIAPHDFGKTVQEFDEQKFLIKYSTIPFTDWSGSSWYPLAMPTSMWKLIGGLSVEFSPGMGSDPDMMMKLWNAGVRYYKGVSASRVYHFGSRTTARVKRNNGYRQFLLKWGIANSTFYKYFLRLGESFQADVQPPQGLKFRVAKLKDRLMKIMSSFF
ncbi:MAG: glycosyltransferase [Flammeovirgaceae bacterium]|nr:glycosyltransferase [Flammeovirgaceae bacterium]